MLSVGKTREGRFLILFVVQIAAWFALLLYHEITSASPRVIPIALAVAQGMGPIFIVVTGTTVVIIEGSEMLSERYTQRRYQEGLLEGEKKGVKRNAGSGRRGTNAGRPLWRPENLSTNPRRPNASYLEKSCSAIRRNEGGLCLTSLLSCFVLETVPRPRLALGSSENRRTQRVSPI